MLISYSFEKLMNLIKLIYLHLVSLIFNLISVVVLSWNVNEMFDNTIKKSR